MSESQPLAWVAITFWLFGVGLLILGVIALSFSGSLAAFAILAGACTLLTAWLGPSRVRERIVRIL
ncbi:MAG TPA: hypothetical protein VFO79_04725, partial [Xanthomonadales bacterium]|nr:hypothetical protein [Xanthomonadales bacterium]